MTTVSIFQWLLSAG